MTTAELVDNSNLIVIESMREKCGLARLQLTRLVGSSKTVEALAQDNNFDSVWLPRLIKLRQLFDTWAASIEARLAEGPVDIWELATQFLGDNSVYQVQRWRTAGWLRSEITEPRGANHKPTTLYGPAAWRELVKANSAVVASDEKRSGPLTPAFQRWLAGQGYEFSELPIA